MNWDNESDARLYGAYYTSEKSKQERQKRELSGSTQGGNTWSFIVKESVKYDYTRPITWGVMLSVAGSLIIGFAYLLIGRLL